MTLEMNITDYKKILNYYNLAIPKSSRLIEKMARDIMSQKLCRCIKKIDKANEARSIGICTKTIFNSKGFTRGKFKCKGKSYADFEKTKKGKTKKRKIR